MALTPRLELKQGQSLVMTPQLQQAIKLLQLSNLELTAYVEQELERNPFLERTEGGDAASTPAPGEGGEAAQQDAPAKDERAELSISEDTVPSDAPSDLDTDYENLYTDASRADMANETAAAHGSDIDWSKAGSGGAKFEGGEMDLDGALSGTPSLRDTLTEQLHVAFSDPTTRMIGAFLIDCVDETGYLRTEIATVAERLGAREDDVARVLGVMQQFDPSGVMARDLAECLAIQLAERDRLDPAMESMLANLELLARRDLSALMRACEVDHEDVIDMIAEIRALNPKPGLAFGTELLQPVVPDVYVRENPQGGWAVELNAETLPKVLVNSVYYSEVSGAGPADDTARAYMTECMANASWLVKSLDQRAKTILKVSTEIVRQQDGFLAHGIQHLRPLNLRTVADAINMHESTVSRVTANKYMATPRGLFELKYFFTSAIASSEGGEAHSAEAVRHRIRDLIDNELPGTVLSDDRIVEVLKASGIDIARRTVAKYREAMRIPSSVQRRRLKKAMA